MFCPSHMPIRMLWIIWKIADPQTTKMNSANSQGPTDDFSSGVDFELLGTFPRCVMFLLCFSFAMRILCLATIMLLQLAYAPQKGTYSRCPLVLDPVTLGKRLLSVYLIYSSHDFPCCFVVYPHWFWSVRQEVRFSCRRVLSPRSKNLEMSSSPG